MNSTNLNTINAGEAQMMAEKAQMMPKLSLPKAQIMDGQKALTLKQKADYAKVAKGFESMFVNMMVKGLKEAMLQKKENNGNTFGADTLEGYGDMLMSDEIAKTGNGIGIADKVYSFLSQGQKYSDFVREFNPKFAGGRIVEPKTKDSSSLTKINGNNLDILNSLSSNNKTISTETVSKLNAKLGNYDKAIKDAADKYKLPESLLKAVISAESAGNNGAVSPAGAKGLMQLTDATASDMGVGDVFNPYQNIVGGAKYLSTMFNRFDGDINMALSAYNAGPSNVEKYNGIPPFKETQDYVNKVKQYNQLFMGLEQ